MTEPKIFYPNLVTTSSEYFYGGNYGMDLKMLTDRRLDLKSYTTSGDDDGITMLTQLSFVNTPFCTDVFVINHNMKLGGTGGVDISTESSGDPGNYFTNLSRSEFTDSLGNNHTFFKFNQISANFLTLSLKNTATANQQKGVAEVIVTRPRIDFDFDFSSYDKKYREKMKEIYLGDGSIHKVITLAGSGKNMRYEANCQFRFVPESILESFFQLKESGETFLFQPESVTRPQDIFLCHLSGTWDAKYSSSYKGSGYTITMHVKEV